MLPSPSSSPRPALENRTNQYLNATTTPQHKSWFSLPTPSTGKRPLTAGADDHDVGPAKRLKFTLDEDDTDYSSSEDNDSDIDAENVLALNRARARKQTVYHIMNNAAMAWPSARYRLPQVSSRPILQSFVSSNKSDLFKCQSTAAGYDLTPPYSCSYSHAAKSGGTPLLAVATEEGSVHILNTSKRLDWDPEPPRITLQPHRNGIFDVKWNASDTILATCSGDLSTRISCPTKGITIAVLRGHTSTVKCVSWDPSHQDLLSTGGRDGKICLWDLRVSGGYRAGVLSPVMSIQDAHEESGKSKGKGRKKAVPLAKSVTNLLYHRTRPDELISSGSFDGILHSWDLRLPTKTKKSAKPKRPIPLYSSPLDPTALNASRRPRGITSLASGSGPTADLIFGLGADSRIHTYSLPYLAAQSSGGYTHEHMQTNSFYVRIAASPCGRWLASGSTGVGANGNIFLYDVSEAGRLSLKGRGHRTVPDAVELKGQDGEVGALDWAEGMLATCADDGSIRVWRPDVETYKSCVEQPEEKKWEWSWSRD